jgi:hypothetical protein
MSIRFSFYQILPHPRQRLDIFLEGFGVRIPKMV